MRTPSRRLKVHASRTPIRNYGASLWLEATLRPISTTRSGAGWPFADIEIPVVLPQIRLGRGIDEETGIGFERTVIAQQSRRTPQEESGLMTRLGKQIVDLSKEYGNFRRSPFVRRTRLGDELRPAVGHVVAAPRRVLVAGQAVEEAAGHRDLGAHRGVRVRASGLALGGGRGRIGAGWMGRRRRGAKDRGRLPEEATRPRRRLIVAGKRRAGQHFGAGRR